MLTENEVICHIIEETYKDAGALYISSEGTIEDWAWPYLGVDLKFMLGCFLEVDNKVKTSPCFVMGIMASRA